jgi:glycerophosphoryl diester phosphodiesterase
MKRTNKSLLVGHRGARGLAAENKMISFETALSHGVDLIETDVHVTRDGVAILHHDHDIPLANGQKLIIKNATYAEVKAAIPDVATLHELIGFLDRRVRLMIEVKEKVPTARIVQIVKNYLHHGWQPDDFIFASFDYTVLKQLYRDLPEVERVVLETWSGTRALSRAYRLKTNKLSMDQKWLWTGFVHAVSGKYELYTYTLNNAKKAARLEKHGLYGVITDRPDYYVGQKEIKIPTYEGDISPQRHTDQPHHNVLVPAREANTVHSRSVH